MVTQSAAAVRTLPLLVGLLSNSISYSLQAKGASCAFCRLCVINIKHTGYKAMLLDQVFDRFDQVKWVFVRKDGKLKKVRRTIPQQGTEVEGTEDKPLFPISKERS